MVSKNFVPLTKQKKMITCTLFTIDIIMQGYRKLNSEIRRTSTTLTIGTTFARRHRVFNISI